MAVLSLGGARRNEQLHKGADFVFGFAGNAGSIQLNSLLERPNRSAIPVFDGWSPNAPFDIVVVLGFADVASIPKECWQAQHGALLRLPRRRAVGFAGL
jgi:hypothetical protein